MAGSVVFVADAGKLAGLGHIARSSAVAVAVRARGLEAKCFALGADAPLRFDGVDWAPLRDEAFPPASADVILVDSYALPEETVAQAAASHRLVVIHDYGSVPRGAALVVSTAALDAGDGRLSGLEYAALRRDFWGLPARRVNERAAEILVTTGSGQFAQTGARVAGSLTEALPDTAITLVRGPHATVAGPPGVDVLDAPRSLLDALLAADVVVSAAGQTMLEAAAAGTPCVALALAQNQRAQADRLAGAGAVRLVDPPEPEAVVAACSELVRDAGARRDLSRKGQRAVDGHGALRIAFHIARVAGLRTGQC